MEIEDPGLEAFSNQAKNAKCEYCGGAPCGGGPDTLAQLTGEGMKNRWMCMSCAPEYYSFIQSEFAKIPEGLTSPEQIAEMRKVSENTDTHMRDFVRRRDN